jgi:hypothetical protein
MGDWETYQQAAGRLGISPEALRQRAIRGNWPRRKSNEGTAIVRVPDDISVRSYGRRTPEQTAVEHSNVRPYDDASVRLVAALEAHIETLKGELAYARAELETERQAALEAIRDYQRVANELASLKAGAPIAPATQAAVKRAESLADILGRIREQREAKSA